MTLKPSTLQSALKTVAVLLLVFAVISFVYGVSLAVSSGKMATGEFSWTYFTLGLFSSLRSVLESIGVALLCLFAARRL